MFTLFLLYGVLILSGVGMAWALYLMYIEWLWNFDSQARYRRSKALKRLCGEILDRDGTVVARID